MGPETALIAIPALAGGVTSYLSANAQNDRAKKQAQQYQQALEWLKTQQQLPVNGFYGSAGPNGATTGNAAYDNAVRAMTQQQLGQQLAAAKLDAARGNLTDAQARARAYSQMQAQNNAVNNRAVDNAARAAIRMPNGTRNMKDLVAAGRANAINGSNVAYANAMNVMANNDANYQQNPAVIDAMRQNNVFNGRQQAYNGMIAQMNAYQPVGGMSGSNAAMSGVTGGLTQGLSNYMLYGLMDK